MEKKTEESLLIEEYEFDVFSDRIKSADYGEVKEYNIPVLDSEYKRVLNNSQKVIKKERSFANDNDFVISPIIQEYRGIKKQEYEEIQDKIKDEVKKRIDLIQDEYRKKGYEEGKKLGIEETINNMKEMAESEIKKFTTMINVVMHNKRGVLLDHQQKIYNLIKSLTKWIILRELNEDGDYIKRLLEKLILELGTRENFLIKVGDDFFNKMPEILEYMKERIGEMKNVRIEVDHDQKDVGIIIESTNEIIDASFDAQMLSLDQLFGTVETEVE